MAKENWVGELIAEVVVSELGWSFCMAMAAGAYFAGFALAQHFGGAEHRDSFGILSAIVLIWIYEHRRAHERWSQLLNQRSGRVSQ